MLPQSEKAKIMNNLNVKDETYVWGKTLSALKKELANKPKKKESANKSNEPNFVNPPNAFDVNTNDFDVNMIDQTVVNTEQDDEATENTPETLKRNKDVSTNTIDIDSGMIDSGISPQPMHVTPGSNEFDRSNVSKRCVLDFFFFCIGKFHIDY